MTTSANVQAIGEEIFAFMERAVDKMYRMDLELQEFASANEFSVKDIKDEDILAYLTPQLHDLVKGYLESAREAEDDEDEE